MVKWLWRAAWLLVPLSYAVHAAMPGRAVLAFSLACLSLLPLARTMGEATESLAARLGPAAGSLLNATFGNAAELIIGVIALRHGRIELVKGSLTGSILGNLLLVAGAAIVAGGLRRRRLRFNRLVAGASVTSLFLSVVAMAAPALLAERDRPFGEVRQLSIGISVVLLVMYGLTLLFQLRTHADELSDTRSEEPKAAALRDDDAGEPFPSAPQRPPLEPAARALGRLVLAAAATTLASEVLVSSLTGTLQSLHLPEMFVGVVIVAIAGNAAEHSTAILFGYRGDLDVALGIPWESSKQIALFVAPVLVFSGLLFGVPMDLAFRPFEVASVALAVLATALFALDGETHWLDGAFLIAVYAVLALAFFHLR
jgi:Ca2+:H+ antiporter